MKNLFRAPLVLIVALLSLVPLAAQSANDEIKTGKLVRRKMENGADNYVYAAYSFKYGGNGPEVQRLCRNNWDLLFGNGVIADSLDVSMVVDDRSRIKDLGKYEWTHKFYVPRLAAYEEPEREPSVRAEVGHIYLVHTRDTDNNHYVLFRVDRLVSGESIEISWKMIAPPQKPY